RSKRDWSSDVCSSDLQAVLWTEVGVDDAGAVGAHGELVVAEEDMHGAVRRDLTGEVPPAAHRHRAHVVDRLVVEVRGGAGGGVEIGRASWRGGAVRVG